MQKVKYFLFFLLTITASACGGEKEAEQISAAYAVIREPEISPGDSVPAPTGEVILTLTGNITTTNVGDELQFDMETIERLGVVTYRVYDKQAEGREVFFEGVLLKQLLAVAGLDPEVTALNAVALNDYAVEIPITDVENYPVLLATSVERERMTVERYGPTRIIYPYHAFALDETVYDPRWIWQLATIELP